MYKHFVNALSIPGNGRYIAVHNPLDYKKAINDASALKHRLVKYLLPVLVAAFIFNIPKFFEATYFAVEKQVCGLFEGSGLGKAESSGFDLNLRIAFLIIF